MNLGPVAKDDVKQKLFDLVKKFIEEQEISCAESIYQMDHVIENAHEFIEKCCELVGYYEYPEET